MSSWLGFPSVKPVQSEVEAFWYLNLTPDQQAACDKLSEHLRETGQSLEGHDDRYTMLRFLKARQWDVQRAAAMYSTMAKWRREYQTDHVYETFTFPEKDAVMKHYPHFYHKTDKFGRPLFINLVGLTDSAKILEATTLDRLVHYHVCEWENLKRKILPGCTALAGQPIIAKTVILDCKGMSMKTFGSAAQRIVKTVVHIDQDYYCESLGQMFIINTPTIFRLAWAMVNPLLEDRTRRKIVILGADYLPTVTQLVPLENLPVFLGGKSEVPDMKTDMGPWTTVQPPEPAKAGAPAGVSNGGAEGVAVKACARPGPVPVNPHGMHHSATAPSRIGDAEGAGSEEGAP